MKPGEVYVTHAEEAISTVLGSCVSVCIRDPKTGIGGMNHFMLPVQSDYNSFRQQLNTESARYGNYAMEQLVNAILKEGGRRDRLELKAFGGGMVINSSSDVGGSNVRFVREYLQAEGYRILTEDLGGAYARKILFMPQEGRVLVKRLQQISDRLRQEEASYQEQLASEPVSGEIELF